MVAVLAVPILGERLTPLLLALAGVVMAGATLTVTGAGHAPVGASLTGASLAQGVAGGVLAAMFYAGTTLLARYAVPRYGAIRVLFYEILGGTLVLALVLPLAGHPPAPPPTHGAWAYTIALTHATVLLANFAFFAAARRIEAAPVSVAATIEPVVGALLALFLLGQQLTATGWLGLAMVVGGVAAGYWREAFAERRRGARMSDAAGPAPPAVEAPAWPAWYFPVSIPTLLVMSVASFGAYHVLWHYQNWTRYRARSARRFAAGGGLSARFR